MPGQNADRGCRAVGEPFQARAEARLFALVVELLCESVVVAAERLRVLNGSKNAIALPTRMESRRKLTLPDEAGRSERVVPDGRAVCARGMRPLLRQGRGFIVEISP